MPEFGKEAIFNKYKNIFGDTKATIEAIQKYLNENSTSKTEIEEALYEEEPAASINKILNSTACEETNTNKKKIINNL